MNEVGFEEVDVSEVYNSLYHVVVDLWVTVTQLYSILSCWAWLLNC